MDNPRPKLVSAISLAVVIPLLVIVYLATRFGSGQLEAPAAVLVVFLLTLVLVWVGSDILRTSTEDEPESGGSTTETDSPLGYPPDSP